MKCIYIHPCYTCFVFRNIIYFDNLLYSFIHATRGFFMSGSAISIKKKRLLYHFYFGSHYVLFYQMTQNLIYIETVKFLNSQHRFNFDVHKVYGELRRDDIAVGKHIFFMEYDLICLLLYQFETNYVKISKKFFFYKYKNLYVHNYSLFTT